MLFLCQYLLNCNLLMGMFHRKRKLFIKRSCSSFFGDFFRVLLTLKQLQTIARICCVIMQKSEKAMATHSILLPGKSHGQRSLVGCSPWGREELDTTELLHFHFNALEKEMATHSSVLAWRIPGTAEPGGLPFMGSHRVGHD